MLNISIIGYGYWGSKLARNFQNSSYFNILSIVDKKRISLINAKRNFPKIKFYSDHKKATKDILVDMIIISTPTSSHFKIAEYALKNSKHVLVEKPLSLSVSEVRKLNILARKKNKSKSC